jgi:microcystin-dependent protein
MDPFLGELQMMSFDFAPRGWAQADGQILPIGQNQALFSLFGITYGGVGKTDFALPDLRDRIPIHLGEGYAQGQGGGEASHALTSTEMPSHAHVLQASTTDGNAPVPTGNVLARTTRNVYKTTSAGAGLNRGTVGSAGSGGAHENRQPFQTVNWCVALQGEYPSKG